MVWDIYIYSYPIHCYLLFLISADDQLADITLRKSGYEHESCPDNRDPYRPLSVPPYSEFTRV